MRVFIALLAALALTGQAWCQTPTFDVCSKPAAPVAIYDVTLDPESPHPGDTLDIQVQSTTKVPITSGKLTIDVKIEGIPIWHEADDICTRTECPVSPGDFSLHAVQQLPPVTPPGRYSVHMMAYDDAGSELMCVDVHFVMLPPSAHLQQVEDSALAMASPDAEVADKSADDAVLVTEAVSGSKDASVKGEGHGRPEKKHHHKGGAKHAHEIPVADLGADIAVEEGAVTEQEGPAGVPAHRAGKGSNKRSRSKGPRSCDSSSESEPSSDSESESESGTEAEEGSEGDRANVGEMLALEETREGVRGGVPLVELLVNRKRRLSARG